MATISIPTRQAESLRGSDSEKIFSAGAWRGKILQTDVKDLPSRNDGSPFAGYQSTEGQRLAVRIGENTPVDGQDDVGGMLWFEDIVLQDGELDIYSIDVTAKNHPSWQLQKSARKLVNLAMALGQTEEVDGNVVVNEGFVEALAAGEFNGTELGYVVYHPKPRNGKVYPEIETFFAV